ncbi:TlpA disulfide reductase family protein [Kaarinaea lacus]
MTKSTYGCLLILFVTLTATSVSANPAIKSQEHQIVASDGTELSFARYPAQGDYLIIWIAPGYGIQQRSLQVAEQLAGEGIEIWQIDLAEALFLPHSTEQMRAFTGQYVADLIQAAHEETGKKILLSARSYGAIPLLRGVRTWQTRKPDTPYVIGAILFSPDLYTTMPSLGLEPEYLPIASATNIPIMIFQDGIRGNRWYVHKLIDRLTSGGSQTMLKILPGVSALFFSEDDAPEALQAIANLPRDIKTSIQLLEKIPSPLTPAPMKKQFQPLGSGIDIRLIPFKGKFQPYPIDLKDASGKRYQRDKYTNQITVINFWATWCPPCVQEIPSLNRLREKMQGIPFELVSINYAESPATIQEFLQKVDVNFPVLLDETGEVSVHWKVVAFPSTFIIGPDGKIHYGVNAAILWDSPEVIKSIQNLYRNSLQSK